MKHRIQATRIEDGGYFRSVELVVTTDAKGTPLNFKEVQIGPQQHAWQLEEKPAAAA